MSGPSSQVRSAIAAAAIVAILATVYYLLPVPGQMHTSSWAIVFSCGTIVLALLIAITIRGLIQSGVAVRLRGLVLLLCLTVLFFAYADDSLAALPDQFVSLHTKTDALYFNISTLATVGFGDVHASGQLARAAVTVQIIFNLIFLGAAVGIISGILRARAQRRLHAPEGGKATGPDPG